MKACISSFCSRGETNGCYLIQPDRSSITQSNGDGFEIFNRRCATNIAYQKLAVILIDKTATRVLAETLKGIRNILNGQGKVAQANRIGCDAVLSHLSANWDHLRDARDVQKPGADGPVCKFPELHR